MAYLGLNFDANTVEPNGIYEPVPTGWYKVSIVTSEMKQTKNGDGQYLQIEMEILEGEYENRKLWDRLNLMNPNQQAVDIAQRTLSAICHSIGVMTVSDSEQLHGKPMLARAVFVPAKGDYDAKNDIKGYKPIVATVPGTGTGAPRPAAASAPSRTAAPRPTAPPPSRAPVATAPVPDFVPNEALGNEVTPPPTKRGSGWPPREATAKPWQKGPPPAPFTASAPPTAAKDVIPF